MSNYLDEYNKRMTYGNAMGFNSDPLAQTARMHADRDRALNQQAPYPAGTHNGAATNIKTGAAFARAVFILAGGLILLSASMLVIEKLEGIPAILAMMGAFGGVILSVFGAVLTAITGLTSIGVMLRRKTFWAIAALSGLCALVSTGLGLSLFMLLMAGWGAFHAAQKLRRRVTPVSTPDPQ